MTRRGFYTMGLWLPVSWPVIISLGEAFLHAFTWHQMSRVSGLILISGLFGGIQYVLFAALVSFRFAHKEMDAIDRSKWLMPMIFAPICSGGLWLFIKAISIKASQLQVRTAEIAPIDPMSVVWNIFIFVLAIGYCYLIVLHALLFILDKIGFLED